MRLIILLWLIIPGLIFPRSVFAESSVWRISNGQSELFIGGTIHVLSHQDYPLPQEFDLAYSKADILVLETDLSVMAGVDAQQQLLMRLMYTDGRTLRDDVMKSTYKKLLNYVQSTGLLMEVVNQFKAPMVVIMLTVAELQRLGMADTGVDNYYFMKADQEGKRLDQLESVEQQVELIANMGKGHEDEMLLSTVDELQELPTVMAAMKTAWRTGNIKQLERLVILPMRQDFPALYQSLLVGRNNSWIPKIEIMLKTPEIELVLVGALHLAAAEGVIAQLIKRGYQVEKL